MQCPKWEGGRRRPPGSQLPGELSGQAPCFLPVPVCLGSAQELRHLGKPL